MDDEKKYELIKLALMLSIMELESGLKNQTRSEYKNGFDYKKLLDYNLDELLMKLDKIMKLLNREVTCQCT